ncbi:glutathione S-transferase [Pseudomonas duriflava]|uniref:Glutathione S-transferase n=1 Tax=Pseudomonas duriflava TaxID=459528 RepID=A0A562QP49_9PSED|nr:glutathione S-transferase family protein [Pseudomonas duriflava]TWI58443.1 glutathione S-transferase [Pseudomonas duriflava]
MTDLILHHYWTSPFAEKVHLLMGFKQLAWRSVIIPRIMPKPDLTALTGGYRKTPVLQVGADIYCDTALIARRLEQAKATPTLYPEGQEFTCTTFAAWADSVVFQHAVALIFQPEVMAERMANIPPEQAQAFLADRKALFERGSAPRISAEQARQHWPTLMARLEQQLARSEGEYLFQAPSIADFSLVHCLWFLKSARQTASLVEEYPETMAWYERVMGFGHGTHTDLSGEEAIQIARAAQPAALPEEASIYPAGLQSGSQVSVSAVDYGIEAVKGELLFSGSEEFIVRREDEQAGVVHVHFPCMGFKIEVL